MVLLAMNWKVGTPSKDFVGFAIEDFSALRYVRDQLQATGLYEELDLLADPDEPRDLFGMLLRAAMQPAA